MPQSAQAPQESPASPPAATPASAVSRSSAGRKRSLGTSGASPEEPPDANGTGRRAKKVSRACDHCKTKKLKCSGTVPCGGCIKRKLVCEYDTSYRRGRPPTPPPAYEQSAALEQPPRSDALAGRESSTGSAGDGDLSTSRASPGLKSAEIQGQYFDLTSSLTFLHRAWKRLSAQRGTDGAVPELPSGNERHQSLFSAGDKPFAVYLGADLPAVPPRATAMNMLGFYFDFCVTTYRLLHQGYVAGWFEAVIANSEAGLPASYGIGHAKASIVMAILAIVSLRQSKIGVSVVGPDKDNGPLQVDFAALQQADAFFGASTQLTDAEVGYPTLESAQARLLQVLYLLQSTRMNQAWFVFGSTLPIASALGLHRRRRPGSKAPADYILSQCRRRTFWVAYTIDKYLAVVFGRPSIYHDEDIDQAFPDRVNDEDMTAEGRAPGEPTVDCHIDSLIYHAKIAQLINRISREVYSVNKITQADRLAAARRAARALGEWRAELPYHLGTLRPASLIPPFRREATALKLAHCHAAMHATRPFLLEAGAGSGVLGQGDPSPLQESVAECLSAARGALETVDAMFADGTLFHAFWWTPYVTFCALAVVYVWEIQQNRSSLATASGEGLDGLLGLAERCHAHLGQTLATDSPSGRYSVILEELRQEAKHRSARPGHVPTGEDVDMERLHDGTDGGMMDPATDQIQGVEVPGVFGSAPGFDGINPLDDWQATDWLDLDSSAFGPYPDFEGSTALWMPQG